MSRTAAFALSTLVACLSSAAHAEAVPRTRTACEAAITKAYRNEPAPGLVEECHAAFKATYSPRDIRNKIASMVVPTVHLTLDDLAVATLLADGLAKNQQEPWATLARCDIGHRVRRSDAVAACLDGLARLAPHDELTRWALETFVPKTPWWLQALRWVLAVVAIGTVGHALWSRRARVRAAAASPLQRAAVVAIVIALLGMGRAHAETPKYPEPEMRNDQISHIPIDDHDPEASVPSEQERNAKPLEFGYFIQDLAARALKAERASDFAKSARYYRALEKTSPTAFAARKACEMAEQSGDLPAAVISCRDALTKDGVIAADYPRFVHLVLAQKDPLPPREDEEVAAVIKHWEEKAAEAKLDLGVLPAVLRCDVAVRFDNRAGLEACTAELVRRAPSDARTVSYQWALAVQRGDQVAARSLAERARELSASPDLVDKMERTTNAMLDRGEHRITIVGGLALLAAGGLVFGTRWRASRRRAAT